MAKATANYGRDCALLGFARARRVRRAMRENGLLAPHRVGHTETKPHNGTIITDKANEMWGTDMTQTITVREGRANVFVTVEHANSEVVGIHASRSANRFDALEPVRQGVHRCSELSHPGWRGIEAASRSSLNYMSGDFQDEIECLGIEASPSFVREPEGNGVAEQFVRTFEGEPAVGEDLRYHRRTASRAHQVRQALQRNLARRPARLSYPSPSAGRPIPGLIRM